jgi:hypothetical protein
MRPRTFPPAAAAIAIDNAPFTGRIVPSSASSPTIAYRSSSSTAIWPLAASSPIAIGKSNEDACFGRSAGARFIMHRLEGKTNPLLTIARSMRWMLSFTACSGRPTSTVFGSAAGETSTSTSTGRASIPSKLKV